MNDTDLTRLWSALEPSRLQRARIENRVLEWLEASETSLLAEWLTLIKVETVAGLGFAAMGALSLAALTPLAWVAASLLR